MTSRDRDFGRKYCSGSSKRKKSEKRKNEDMKLTGSLTKYLKPSEEKNSKELELCAVELTSTATSSTDPSHLASASSDVVCDTVTEGVHSPIEEGNNMDFSITSDEDAETSFSLTENNVNVSDPFLWPKVLNDSELTSIVKKGPVRISKDSYPLNDQGRHFSNVHFTKVLVNGEIQDRRWLVYSETNDSVYCFACRLFSINLAGALGSQKGSSDWKHLSELLKSHDNSKSHKDCMMKWLSFQKGLSLGKTIDAQTQAQLESEQQRWRNVLERLLAIVKYLATHNLSFRGHEENILSQNSSGNFLDLVKLIAQFDPVLHEHLSRVMDGAISTNHYLSKTTQNEFIDLMAIHVKNQIIEKVKKNKYYSIILDCTRDISRIEQMSIILRITNQETAEIEEHFLEFVAVEKTTAERLADYIIDKLKELGLPLADCRGQGYDNGANMRGEKSGVQRRLLNMNPLAFFVPCGCHSWNLVLGDAASSCAQAQTFFGILQRLYTIFSCSSERWSILKSHVSISLKPLSETRWECRSESVKAVRYQLGEVCDALSDLRKNSTDCGLISECQSLENEISTYEFVVSLVVWYDILVKIHTMSKVWQSVNMQLDVALKHLESFVKWLDEYRNQGFQSALVSAKEVAEEAGIETTFKSQRRRRKKRMFEYEQEDDIPEITSEDSFKINYFLVVIDAVRMSCEPRFSALKTYQNSFGFMYHIKDLRNTSDEELMKNCKDLRVVLSDGDHHDIDALELFDEIRMLSLVYDEMSDNVLSVLKYIAMNNLKDIYPNVFITLRIIATMPVTVASAERSFSKLKLIKTYLRNTMKQDRLSSLALLSIENDLVSKMNFREVIDEFSRRKSRKVRL